MTYLPTSLKEHGTKSSQNFPPGVATTAPDRNVENGSGPRMFVIIAMAAPALPVGDAKLRYVASATTSGMSRGIALPTQTQLSF